MYITSLVIVIGFILNIFIFRDTFKNKKILIFTIVLAFISAALAFYESYKGKIDKEKLDNIDNDFKKFQIKQYKILTDYDSQIIQILKEIQSQTIDIETKNNIEGLINKISFDNFSLSNIEKKTFLLKYFKENDLNLKDSSFGEIGTTDNLPEANKDKYEREILFNHKEFMAVANINPSKFTEINYDINNDSEYNEFIGNIRKFENLRHLYLNNKSTTEITIGNEIFLPKKLKELRLSGFNKIELPLNVHTNLVSLELSEIEPVNFKELLKLTPNIEYLTYDFKKINDIVETIKHLRNLKSLNVQFGDWDIKQFISNDVISLQKLEEISIWDAWSIEQISSNLLFLNLKRIDLPTGIETSLELSKKPLVKNKMLTFNEFGSYAEKKFKNKINYFNPKG